MTGTADQQLVSALAERGITISIRQARRWRETGLLPEPISAGGGRRGRQFAYAPEAIDQAAALHAILQTDRDASRACARLFLKGYEPRERALRSAYRQILGAQEAEANRPGSRAENDAKHLSRRASGNPGLAAMKRRLRDDDSRASLSHVLTNVLSVIYSGAGEIETDAWVALTPNAHLIAAQPSDRLGDAVQHLDPVRLRTVADDATPDEWRQARGTLNALVLSIERCATAAELIGRNKAFIDARQAVANERTCILLLPVLVSVNRVALGGTLNRALHTINADPRFDALMSLGSALPRSWHRYLRPLGELELAKKPPAFRARVHDRIRAWAIRHPDLAEHLHPLTE